VFAILDHALMNQQSLGLPYAAPGALFFRGSTTVAFFLSLSGVLVTYLSLVEVDKTGTVRAGRFYLRLRDARHGSRSQTAALGGAAPELAA